MSKSMVRSIGLVLALFLCLQFAFPLGVSAEPASDILEETDDAVVLAVPEEQEDEASSQNSSSASPSEFEGIQIVQRNSPGCTFTVEAYDVSNARSVQIGVWTESDQSDLQRFDAQRFLTLWSADVDIADFGSTYGTYFVEVFATTAEGEISAGTASIDIGPGEDIRLAAHAQDDSQCIFQLALAARLPGDPFVFMEVRSPEGSFIRYPAIKRSNVYTAFANVGLTPSAGIYTVNAYCGSLDSPVHLASTQFEVAGVPETSVSVRTDKSTGRFEALAQPVETQRIDRMMCAVWSAADQSDLLWVDMQESDEGWVTPELSVTQFDAMFGSYCFHVYGVLQNGIMELAAGVQVPIEAENYVWIEKPEAGQYAVRILNPSPAGSIRAAVWSDEDGQDDIIWYDAADDGNGILTATVLARQHADSGSFTCHVYAEDTLVGALSFEVPAAEVLSAAELRIANGCQRVYDEVGRELHDNYMWVVNNFSYVRRSGHLTPASGYTREQWYAVEGLEKQSGNCYTFAAAFCALAKGLGYDAEYVEGAVYGVGQKWWPHGFVLIHQDGATYICDPELQYASSSDRNLYMQPVSSPKATYRW